MSIALISMTDVIDHRRIMEPENLIFGGYGERWCQIIIVIKG